jgi:hypothetical protein
LQVEGGGFHITLPAGWHAYAPQSGLGDDKKQSTFLLDPDAVVSAQIATGPLSSLEESERESPTAWTNDFIAEFKKVKKEFAVREPGVQAVTVGEQKGASMIADFLDGESRKTLYGVAIFKADRAFNLRFSAPADKFEELKPTFDAMVESLKLE